MKTLHPIARSSRPKAAALLVAVAVLGMDPAAEAFENHHAGFAGHAARSAAGGHPAVGMRSAPYAGRGDARALAPRAGSAGFVRTQWHGPNTHFAPSAGWHAPVARYGPGAHWERGWHGDRWGWWWVDAGLWSWYATYPYYYGYPYYPYYDPYYTVPPGYAVPNPDAHVPAGSVPPTPQSWYYCDASATYYPYVQSCASGWRAVPATPPSNAAPSAPAPTPAPAAPPAAPAPASPAPAAPAHL